MSKCENIFAKDYVPNRSEDVFLVKKVKNTFSWTCIMEKNGKEIVGALIVEKLRVEKVMKRKGDKLYIKWKGCNNSFDIWVNKRVIVI